MKFSDKLKKIRKEGSISQEMLAEALGVSRQAVGKWENGQGYPEIEKLIIISEMFDVSIDYLLKDNAGQYDETKEQENKKKYTSDQTDEDIDYVNEYATSVEHMAENTNSKTSHKDKEYYADIKIVESYLAHKKCEGHKIGMGVAIIIASVAFPIAIEGVLGPALLLSGIAIGVAIFVLQSFVPKQYWDSEANYDVLDPQFLKQYQISHQMITQKYGKFITGGILLIFAGVISAVLEFATAFPIFVGIGVYLFIFANYGLGASKDVVNNFKDLELDQRIDELEEDSDYEQWNLLDFLQSLAGVIYIAIGFIWDVWHPTWLIFVVIWLLEGFLDAKRTHNQKQKLR